MAHLEIVAFRRRILLGAQYEKFEDDKPEPEPDLEEEQTGPAHYIPTPMKVYPDQLGFHLTGYRKGFEREVN